MEGLMFSCINWGGMDCHPDVSVHKHPRKRENGVDTPLWPVGDALRELDDICESYELRFFEIEKRECPVCEGQEFTERTGLEIQGDETKSFENSYLKCNTCGTPSILLKSD